MMQTKGLCKSLLGAEEQPIEPAPLANEASDDDKKNQKVQKDVLRKKLQTSSGNGTICGPIWHWL